jgi:hypothetical protein
MDMVTGCLPWRLIDRCSSGWHSAEFKHPQGLDHDENSIDLGLVSIFMTSLYLVYNVGNVT